MDKKFGDLKIGEEFEVYGDIHLNYDFPKICKCVKRNENTGTEIDGISFLINPTDIVYIKVER